jgi:hypothetical protein
LHAQACLLLRVYNRLLALFKENRGLLQLAKPHF